ncbi:unnamed protein product [Ectocarpus sp. 12 AP-2014]
MSVLPYNTSHDRRGQWNVTGVLTVGCGVAKSLLAGIIKLWCLPACLPACLALAGLAV